MKCPPTAYGVNNPRITPPRQPRARGVSAALVFGGRAVAIDAVGPLALEARLRDGSRVAADLQALWADVKSARPGERGRLVDAYLAGLLVPHR